MIFDAKEFLDADVMLASLIVIGLIGFATERLVFGSIERATIYRWGMARAARVSKFVSRIEVRFPDAVQHLLAHR